MELHALRVPDAFEVVPRQFRDERGTFLEWFRADLLTEVSGRRLPVEQANLSVSHRGVVRGVHFADVPPGQAKLVTCPAGAALDVVVDLRVGSATFGQWDSVLLDGLGRRAVFVGEGLGHGFVALSGEATVAYLCSAPYSPSREHAVHPLDSELGIDWGCADPSLSPKDSSAPSLAEAWRSGLLPSYAACRRLYRQLSPPGS